MTEAIAAFAATYGPIDDETAGQVRRHLLDWAGLVPGGRAYAQSSESILAAISGLSETDVPVGIPTGHILAPDRAALLAGTFAHSLDFDDTDLTSSLHPGAPVISAVMPVARSTAASSQSVLSAISLGYDVTCAVGRAVDPAVHYDRGFHVTATCGTFGAVAAVGSLLGFDVEKFEAAFGVAGSQAAGSLQFLENGAWNKRLHPGLAAQRGVVAAHLVDAGFRGATRPLTGDFGFLHGYTDNPHPEQLEQIEPGAAVTDTGLKPYPCCRYMHPAIDGLLELAPEVSVDDIERIVIDVPRSGVQLTGDPIDRKRRPQNFVDSQFSMPFAAALALGQEDTGLHAFLDAQDRLDDPDLVSRMDRVEVVSTDRTNEPFPDRWSAHVMIEDATGRHERYVDRPRGEPERPLADATLDAKVRELLAHTPLDADAVIETVRGIGLHATMDELFDVIEET